jgi:DNA-binding response OmpR family regulator
VANTAKQFVELSQKTKKAVEAGLPILTLIPRKLWTLGRARIHHTLRRIYLACGLWGEQGAPLRARLARDHREATAILSFTPEPVAESEYPPVLASPVIPLPECLQLTDPPQITLDTFAEFQPEQPADTGHSLSMDEPGHLAWFNGKELHLRGRAFEVLLALAKHALQHHGYLRKVELYRCIWHDENDALNLISDAIMAIRKEIEHVTGLSRGESSHIVETKRGAGYRLTVPRTQITIQ